MKGRAAGFLMLLGLLLPLAELSAATLDQGLSAYRARDYAYAFDVFDSLSRQGDSRATFYLSLLYAKGLGVVENTDYSLELLQRAARAGDPLAQYNLGNRFVREGTNEYAPEQALEWWKKAANQGLVPAQHNLASLYAQGLGVKRDLEKARHWYGKAAGNGSERSAEALQKIAAGATPAPARKRTPVRVDGGGQTELVSVTPAWIDAQQPGAATLQLAALRERTAIQRLVQRYSWKRPLLLYRTKSGKNALWVLGYGLFPNKDAARKSRAELPAKLQQAGPWARPLQDIRKRLLP